MGRFWYFGGLESAKRQVEIKDFSLKFMRKIMEI